MNNNWNAERKCLFCYGINVIAQYAASVVNSYLATLMLRIWSQYATVEVLIMPAFTLTKASVACFICVEGRRDSSLRDNRIIPESLWFIHQFYSPCEKSGTIGHIVPIEILMHGASFIQPWHWKNSEMFWEFCERTRRGWNSLGKVGSSHNLQCGQSKINGHTVWEWKGSEKGFSING